MSRTFEYDVFLSYSSKDKKTVHALAKRLKKDGLRVWLYAWEIQPGDSIPLKIQRGLERSRTLLMCMSPAYFDSEWGTLEHHTLLFRNPTNSQRRFIPLLIAECTPPDIIAQFAHIDWRTPSVEAYAKLLAASGEEKPKKARHLERKKSKQLPIVLKGHTGAVHGVAVTPDGKTVVSASWDKTLKVWNLQQLHYITEVAGAARYTNAKVVLVGKTGVGKTGLALRPCEEHWEPTESTHGMIVSRLELPPGSDPAGMEREVWLWDFAGQPDYRLIHQLYMDETALGVLVFDPQDDNPFEEIGYWEKALRAATKYEPTRLLVAARCDRGGITISRKLFDQYVQKQGFAGFLSTGAKSGEECEELKSAIAQSIPWERLPWTATSKLFKALKDAIIQLTDEKAPLVRLSELHQRLQLLLPEEAITEADLRAVVGLMQGQGVVQMLAFGDFVLLQPEWINRYASVVVRMAREHVDEMGVVPEKQVLEGDLDYEDMKRLSEACEKILLRAMIQTFLDRSLCLRQETPRGTMLVFPSYFRRDKPDQMEHPNVFVTYGFAGPQDEIYTTLVFSFQNSIAIFNR